MKGRQAELNVREIGIYTGAGTSHSWLWFVELLEKMDVNSLIFVNEQDLQCEKGLDGIDAFLLSGGDTFAIAEGMGERGAKNLERFIFSGGLYFGSCAGAYLPLNSTTNPLNLLNLARVRISNLIKSRPPSLVDSEKFCTPYGCRYVYHPVRDEVRIVREDGASTGAAEITAPLYGGPCM